MVSFCCEACNDIIKKPKTVVHYSRCGAPLTCLDCNKVFHVGEFQKHTSCISEAQRYQGHLFKGDKPGKAQKKALREQQAMNGHAGTNVTNGASSKPEIVTPMASTSQAATDTEMKAEEPVKESATTAEADKKEKKRKRKEEKRAKEGKVDGANPEESIDASTGAANGDVKGETEGEPKKKKKKSKSKGAENGDAGMMAEDKPAEHPADALERVLAEALKLTGESVTIKDVLEKANVGSEALQYLVLSEFKKKWQVTVER